MILVGSWKVELDFRVLAPASIYHLIGILCSLLYSTHNACKVTLIVQQLLSDLCRCMTTVCPKVRYLASLHKDNTLKKLLNF